MEIKKDTGISFNNQDSKNSLILRLFEKDNHLLFAYKKLERIVSALYLVTNLFSDNEPVKWQFRTLGTNILSHTLTIASGSVSRSEITGEIVADLVKVTSLLDISFVAGLVSEMNFNILQKELGNVIEIIDSKCLPQNIQVGRKIIFDKEFFAINPDQLNADSGSVQGHSFPGQVTKDSDGVFSGSQFVGQSERSLTGNKQLKGQYKGQLNIKDKTVREISGRVSNQSGQKNFVDREATIIGLLKTKTNLTIKDFISDIKGCSAKTVQRELLRLVREGVLKKEGDRRWSRYSLMTR